MIVFKGLAAVVGRLSCIRFQVNVHYVQCIVYDFDKTISFLLQVLCLHSLKGKCSGPH